MTYSVGDRIRRTSAPTGVSHTLNQMGVITSISHSHGKNKCNVPTIYFVKFNDGNCYILTDDQMSMDTVKYMAITPAFGGQYGIQLVPSIPTHAYIVDEVDVIDERDAVVNLFNRLYDDNVFTTPSGLPSVGDKVRITSAPSGNSYISNKNGIINAVQPPHNKVGCYVPTIYYITLDNGECWVATDDQFDVQGKYIGTPISLGSPFMDVVTIPDPIPTYVVEAEFARPKVGYWAQRPGSTPYFVDTSDDNFLINPVSTYSVEYGVIPRTGYWAQRPGSTPYFVDTSESRAGILY